MGRLAGVGMILYWTESDWGDLGAGTGGGGMEFDGESLGTADLRWRVYGPWGGRVAADGD